MKHIVRKIFYNYEKEEKYLNEMSAKGMALIDYSWCKYVFEDAPKGEYIYRIELLEYPVDHPESQNYIKFMEETGVELVAFYRQWVYFRRRAADGAFDIYSDIDSRINHLKRIKLLFSSLMILNYVTGLLNLSFGNMELSIGLTPINIFVGILTTIVGLMLMGLLVLPLDRKIKSLEKEKEIRE